MDNPTTKYPIAAYGRVFSQATTPVGKAIPIFSATDLTDALVIWNPPDSGVDCEILEVNVAYASGTATFGPIGLVARLLREIATGALMTAMAATTPKNGRFNKGVASQVRSSNAGTNTVTAGVAGDWWRTLFSINLEAQTGTAHGTLMPAYDPSEKMLVPPGTLVYLAAGAATSALYASHIVWREWNSGTWN